MTPLPASHEPRPTTSRSLLWTIALGLAFTLSACTGGGRSESAAQRVPDRQSASPEPVTSPPPPVRVLHTVVAASRKTMRAGSSRIALKIEATSSLGSTGYFSVRGSGAFDYANRKGHLSMSIPSAEGQRGGMISMILDENVLFERLPSAARVGTP